MNFGRGHDRPPHDHFLVVTFGYKFGVPYDIDLLFDVRFIRNPFFVPELKALTGEDARVQQYVFGAIPTGSTPGTSAKLFGFLIPLYERDQRSYLSIGIGCTGGRHRSVTIALRLQAQFAALGYDVSVTNRDLQNPSPRALFSSFSPSLPSGSTFLTGGLYQLYLISWARNYAMNSGV